MRRIDKSKKLAIAYFSWIDEFVRKKQQHPKYNSSHRFYKDILVNLLHCQGGVCAYTEILITEEKRCAGDKFDSAGKYISGNKTESGFSAQLDHFDSDLKMNQGWGWENF